MSATTDITTTKPDREAILSALETAIIALNAAPNFDTRIADPDNPHRSMNSYKLIPKLEAIIRQARGRQ